MARYDFNAQRLFVEADLAAGAAVACSAEQANYLRNVLRPEARRPDPRLQRPRRGVAGASLREAGKRGAALSVDAQVRPQEDGPDIDYLFAPLKRARLDYLVQKATEMGVARLRPVLTRHTTPERVNMQRMRANAIEAAEQCGILRIPEVHEPEKLERVVAGWDAAPHAHLLRRGQRASAIRSPRSASCAPGRSRLLIGPEGGFAEAERELLSSKPFVTRIPLGPRILRADTAAVAALALLNAALGDWR